MVNNTLILAEEGVLKPPFHYGFSLGFRGALPANAYNLHFLTGLIPAGSKWGLIHNGMKDLSLLATAIGMGATFVRVGFEDSIYFAPGCIAKNNIEFVEKLVQLITAMGFGIADTREAREILDISNKK